MTTCLVLGGAACLHDDLAAYTGPVDAVGAVNDAISEWPGELDFACSLHPRFMVQGPSWLKVRADRSYPAPRTLYCHAAAKEPLPPHITRTELELPGQGAGQSGSSGLLAAKVALVDLGYDRVVLCGVPMTPTPHIDGATNWSDKPDRSPCLGFRNAWLEVDEEYRRRMRSLSGWTAVLLGKPETAKETA